MTKSLRLEMPYYLLRSYADLSLAQERYIHQYPGAKYPGFQHNFALLSLNAAIVEGTLRSILHWRLLETANQVIEKGVQAGQTGPDLAERTFTKFRVDVDTSDTWNKLKTNFKYVFGKSVGDIATQPLLVEIEHLFTIRNRAAHGSSIQLPAKQISEADDEYLFALQTKLDALSKYLQSKLGASDVYVGLGHKDASASFWETTKLFFEKFNGLYNFPAELKKNLDAIQNYTFGKIFTG